MFNSMEGDRHDQHNLHRMHVKLLAIRNLEETMQKIVNRRRTQCLNQLHSVTQGYVDQFSAVFQLRKVLNLNR